MNPVTARGGPQTLIRPYDRQLLQPSEPAGFTAARKRLLRAWWDDDRGAFLSDYLEDALNDEILGTTQLITPTNWMSLHSAHPGETGASELVGGSYARQTTAFDASAAGVSQNTAAETFTNITGAPNEVGYLGFFDAVTVGNFLWYAPLGGTPATFTAANTGDVFTSFAHGLVNDNRVFVTAWPGSALPAGAAEATDYFIVGATTDTFQIALTQGGAAVLLTSDGEGIAYQVDFRAFTNGDNFSVAIGNAVFSSN
jgi:hypothetical protein